MVVATKLNHGLFSSATPEWYTPPALIADIVGFFGEIDLDPCADPEHRVPARRHYTRQGLTLPWFGRVYTNPPYGREIGLWVMKARTCEAEEVILLLPARTDTAWFQPLLDECTICFIRGRLKFSGSKNSAPFPSALVYRGPRRNQFVKSFAHWGKIV